MRGHFSFVCSGCKKSLLSEATIYRDPSDNQYCTKCWKSQKMANPPPESLLARFPPGSSVYWGTTRANGSWGPSLWRKALVVRCGENRVRILVDGGERWVYPESLSKEKPTGEIRGDKST